MTERPNIRRMQVPERKEAEALEFDPKVDITSEDWRAIMSEIAIERNQERWESFMTPAARIKNIDEYRAIPISRDSWSKIMAVEETMHPPQTISRELEYIKAIKTLRPDTDFENDRPQWMTFLKDKIEQAHFDDKVASWHGVTTFAANLKVLYPDMPRPADKDWQKMLRTLWNDRAANSYSQSSKLAANMRILHDDPELCALPVEWNGIKQLLQTDRTMRNYFQFLEVAEHAKILAADKVKLTDKGIEFIMRKPQAGGTASPLPQAPEI